MADTRRYAIWAAFGIGTLAVIGSDVLEPPGRIHLWLTAGGAALMFFGIVAFDVVERGCLVDERYARIHYRSGYFAFVTTGALMVTGTLVFLNTDLAAPSEVVLPALAALGFVVYRGSIRWLERTM